MGKETNTSKFTSFFYHNKRNYLDTSEFVAEGYQLPCMGSVVNLIWSMLLLIYFWLEMKLLQVRYYGQF